MSKYIFATKFKKIEKEPLYYNMQISVDKDCLASELGLLQPGGMDYNFYKDSPIILFFNYKNGWIDLRIYIYKAAEKTRLYLDAVELFSICDGDYPLPEIISVVPKNGVTVTFTPIPVYE